MPQPQKKSSRAIDELISEVQDIRDLVAKIEKRSVYLNPDGMFRSAWKRLGGGIMHGMGALLGGIIVLILLGFLVQRALTSEKVQGFIGDQIQSAVTGAVEKQLNTLPWR